MENVYIEKFFNAPALQNEVTRTGSQSLLFSQLYLKNGKWDLESTALFNYHNFLSNFQTLFYRFARQEHGFFEYSL